VFRMSNLIDKSNKVTGDKRTDVWSLEELNIQAWMDLLFKKNRKVRKKKYFFKKLHCINYKLKFEIWQGAGENYSFEHESNNEVINIQFEFKTPDTNAKGPGSKILATLYEKLVLFSVESWVIIWYRKFRWRQWTRQQS